MKIAKYPVEKHRQAFLLWANGVSIYRLSRMSGFPRKPTLMAWRSEAYNQKCGCGYHGWDRLKQELQDEIKRFREEELGSFVIETADAAGAEVPEYQDGKRALQEFIKANYRQLKPVFKRIEEAFGIRTKGGLTGNLDVDMVVTGYLAVLKVRHAIAKITVDDAYQLIQLLRTVVQIFKEWNIPITIQEDVEERVEIKLETGERPTMWKDNAADEKEEVGVADGAGVNGGV